MKVLEKQQLQLEEQLNIIHDQFVELSKKINETTPFNENHGKGPVTPNQVYDKLRNDIIEKANLYQAQFKVLYSIKAMELQIEKDKK